MHSNATSIRSCVWRATMAACLLAATLARAETGVSDSSIAIGQSAVFSGPVAATGSQYRNGFELYFSQVNKAGGIHGRKLALTSLDDAYDPARTVANTRALIDQNKVFALVGYVATANLIAALPIVEESHTPLFAPLVGTTSFRTKHSHYLFHLRASYRDELSAIVKQLSTVGIDRIAVIYQDSTFGKANLETLVQLAAEKKLNVAATLPMAIAASDANAITQRLKEVQPGAVIIVMAGKMTEVFIDSYRKAGIGAQIYTISVGVADAKASAERLKGGLSGVVTASTVPSPQLERYRVVKEYRRALAESDIASDSYTVLEGYIAAKVFTEGLRRAGRDLTREKFIAALEGLGRADMGDFPIEYGPKNHNGSNFVTLEMFRADGSLIR